MLTDNSLREFTDALASGEPVPGGGAAAGLVGANGAALVSMVCNLTIGRPKYQGVEAELREVLAKAEALRSRLLDLLEADAQAYSKVMRAYRLPRGSDDEKRARTAAIQAALREASLTPLEMVRACRELIGLCPAAAEKGNAGAVSDAGVAAILAAAALESAALNVKINLVSLKDASFTGPTAEEIDRLQSEAASIKARVDRIVASRLGSR